MPNTLQSVFDLPDVSFIENDTLQNTLNRLIANYEKKYKEITGKAKSLAPADPMRILLNAIAEDVYLALMHVDRAGKQDLLKYSYGEFLDNLGAGRSVTRQQAAAATVTVRFTLSEKKNYVIGIPKGTRVTNGDGIYFQTTEYTEVKIGDTTVDVVAECTEVGVKGNDLVPGQINIIVDPIAYVESVTNVDTSDGGAELETDASFAERIYLAPFSYSVAGPEGAYIYWAKTYNTSIGSVKPVSPSPGAVDVYILMDDGTTPSPTIVNGLQEYLRDNNIRPLTDNVTVKTPTEKQFNINLKYYINRSDSGSATQIQEMVNTAINEFVEWQTTEIGKDINPSELIKKIRAAGAKRVEVTAPVFTVVAETEVPRCGEQTVNYGGLEDD